MLASGSADPLRKQCEPALKALPLFLRLPRRGQNPRKTGQNRPFPAIQVSFCTKSDTCYQSCKIVHRRAPAKSILSP